MKCGAFCGSPEWRAHHESSTGTVGGRNAMPSIIRFMASRHRLQPHYTACLLADSPAGELLSHAQSNTASAWARSQWIALLPMARRAALEYMYFMYERIRRTIRTLFIGDERILAAYSHLYWLTLKMQQQDLHVGISITRNTTTLWFSLVSREAQLTMPILGHFIFHW